MYWKVEKYRMKKIAIIGHFGGNCNVCDGQSIKTRIVTDEIEKVEGFQNINTKKLPTFLKNHCLRLA